MEELIIAFFNAHPILKDIVMFLDGHPAGKVLVLYGPLLIGFGTVSFLTRSHTKVR